MISKQNLLKKIDTLLDLKKELTPLLSRHITSAVSFSGLKKGDQDAITEKLKSMATEQGRHKQLLEGIKGSVTRGNSNAY